MHICLKWLLSQAGACTLCKSSTEVKLLGRLFNIDHLTWLSRPSNSTTSGVACKHCMSIARPRLSPKGTATY